MEMVAIDTALESNLNSLLASIASSSGTTTNNTFTALQGTEATATVTGAAPSSSATYGLYQCCGDLSAVYCVSCVRDAAAKPITRTPRRRRRSSPMPALAASRGTTILSASSAAPAPARATTPRSSRPATPCWRSCRTGPPPPRRRGTARPRGGPGTCSLLALRPMKGFKRDKFAQGRGLCRRLAGLLRRSSPAFAAVYGAQVPLPSDSHGRSILTDVNPSRDV
ncbi:hypothetical protein PR202_gb09212 [Eleusine coracana subsp. coracana]|uniref:Gnk2-homologous domain-containing protein n=1 Tax=Eleusine coracana subsp. coracana TaxID=191504 RepID=A0AAV5EHP9_ELECO|nr:hypothetical protein PR202_gb09212 [Eleusine coracana subsp. coracana]